jgi:hypothetical protein
VLYADYYSGFLRLIGKVGGAWQRITVAGQPDPAYFATGLASPVDFGWGPNGDLYWLGQYDDTGQPQTGELHRIHAGEPAGVTPDPTSTPLALTASPNPAREAVTLRFALPRDGTVSLTVKDVGGRVVARVVDGPAAAGWHAVQWDGRDPEGRPAPAGVYMARLETPTGLVTARLIRLH